MNELKKLVIDTKNYSIIGIMTQFGWWGVLNFRIAAFFWNARSFRFLYYIYFPIWRCISFITGIEIYGKTKIGEGLKIIHHGQIFINPKSILGKNCLLYNNISIGSADYEGGDCPVIGDNVKIGVGARVLGKIEIGNNSKIGANSVVLHSFPENSIIVGITKQNEK